MNGKIRILDIEIDDRTAKEAMKETVRYMSTEPVSVIELVTVDTLMYAKTDPELKENIEECDLVLAGEKELLKAADITDQRCLKEVEAGTYLKMFLRYLHKHHLRVYLLVETEEQAEELYGYLEDAYGGIQIVGIAKIAENDRADDMVVNAVNGGEVDCVVAALPAPLQEEFVVRNRNLMNARVWIGLGKAIRPFYRSNGRRERFTQFILHRIFKREIEKNRREMHV